MSPWQEQKKGPSTVNACARTAWYWDPNSQMPKRYLMCFTVGYLVFTCCLSHVMLSICFHQHLKKRDSPEGKGTCHKSQAKKKKKKVLSQVVNSKIKKAVSLIQQKKKTSSPLVIGQASAWAFVGKTGSVVVKGPWKECMFVINTAYALTNRTYFITALQVAFSFS